MTIASRLITDIIARCYATHLKEHCRGRLLDLGCGSVPLYGAYRPFIEDNVCVDWGESLHNNRHIDHLYDLAQDLPFPDDSFDTIIFSDVLEHLPEPARIWAEMARVLRPGGKILLNVPFYYWVHEAPHDYYRYTEFALRRFATKAGFEVLALYPIGGVPEIVTDILAKVLLRFGRPGQWGAIVVQYVCEAFIRTRFGRRVSEGTAVQFPFGYFMVVEKRSAPAAQS